MTVTIEEQLLPALDRFGNHASDTLLVTDCDDVHLALPGSVTASSPSTLHTGRTQQFDLVVVILSKRLSELERFELPLLIHASMRSGACLLVSAAREAFIEFPEVRVKFTVPPDGTDLTLSVYRCVL